MSIFFNWHYDRVTLKKWLQDNYVTQPLVFRELVFHTRWSMSYLSKSQATSMRYSSSVLTQTRWQTRIEFVPSMLLRKWNVDVRGKFHRHTFISASFMFCLTLWSLCQEVALLGIAVLLHLRIKLTHWCREEIFLFVLHKPKKPGKAGDININWIMSKKDTMIIVKPEC